MKETITDILNSIDRHIKSETECGAINRTVGRGRVMFGKNEVQVWVTNRESKSSSRFFTDQYGWQVSLDDDIKVDTYIKDGPVTNKNSPWGRAILLNNYGEYTAPTQRGIMKFMLENSAKYIQTNGDAERLTIGYGEKGWMSLGKLQEALRKYAQNIDNLQTAQEAREAAKVEKKRLEEEAKRREEERKLELQRIKDEEEKKRLEELHRQEEEERQRKIREEEERIQKLKEETLRLENELTDQMEEYAKAASFIRKQATLRFNPVLDKVQDEIKFSNLFNGTTTIINGGPGTGKTTTLIQRLKLLICKLDLQDYVDIGECKLTDEQLDIVSDNGGNWMFFSPTELLKEYLKENMNYEGLQDTSNKVQVWNTYLGKILRDKYHLAGDNAPFSFKKKEHEGTVLIRERELDVLDSYRAFFMNSIKKEMERVAMLDISSFNWKLLGGNIIKDCKVGMNTTELRDLYVLLMRMERFMSVPVFEAKTKSISNFIDDYYSGIQDMASKYMASWKRDNEFYKSLLAIYRTDDLDDETVEDDDSEEFYGATAENKLALDLRHLMRLLALRHLQNVEIEGRKATLLKAIADKIDVEILKDFSDIAFFNKNVAPLIKGYVDFIMSLLVKSYKAFRKEQLELKDDRWNIPLLKRIVSNDNRPLHPQEQALLLGFVNNVILDIKGISISRYEALTDEKKGHKYGKAFKELCRPVIGIDEATDYSLLDFYAINSLRHPEVSSITMTGDGMQCLKENGIFEWKMLGDKRLFTKVEVKNLNISYRQSRELLRLAHSLYRRVLHKIAPYKCYFEEMDNVPKPLWYENDDEEKKAKWIVQRILEIKENYGFVPSIAVFVSNAGDAKFLTEYISDQGKLDEAGIEVKDCSGGDKLAANDTVRIFPIDKVKGMEFEVVFFYDIDKIENLVERYLYVGLSRATFYMGVTSNTLDNDMLVQIQKQFNRRGNWKTLVNDSSEETADNSAEKEKENTEEDVVTEDSPDDIMEVHDVDNEEYSEVDDIEESDFVRNEAAIDELNKTTYLTFEMIEDGYTPEEIAELRELKTSTIYGHIATLVEYGVENVDNYVDLETYNSIVDSFNRNGGWDALLSEIKNDSEIDVNYNEINLVLADLRRLDEEEEENTEEYDVDEDNLEVDIDELSQEEQEIRRYLIDRYACSDCNLSYTDLIREMELDYDMSDEDDYSTFLEMIENITRFEVEHDRPMLSAVIIKKKDMQPGRGFYKLASELGFGKSSELRNNGFWERERERLKEYWQ